MNPVLVQCTGLGYLFNMYRGKPLVSEGGTVIICHPLRDEFHPSIIRVTSSSSIAACARPPKRPNCRKQLRGRVRAQPDLCPHVSLRPCLSRRASVLHVVLGRTGAPARGQSNRGRMRRAGSSNSHGMGVGRHAGRGYRDGDVGLGPLRRSPIYICRRWSLLMSNNNGTTAAPAHGDGAAGADAAWKAHPADRRDRLSRQSLPLAALALASRNRAHLPAHPWRPAAQLGRMRREILDSPVFGPLREHLGDRFDRYIEKKLSVLAATSPKTIWSPRARRRAAAHRAVVHCAGLVNFEARWRSRCRSIPPASPT